MDLQVAMELLEDGSSTGLKALGWTAGWDARQRFGACWPRRKRIARRLLTENQ